MDVNERIRFKVRQEMMRQGITQAVLARQLGIKPPSLSQILNGKYGHIPTSLLDVLGELGLTLVAVRIADLEGVIELTDGEIATDNL